MVLSQYIFYLFIEHFFLLLPNLDCEAKVSLPEAIKLDKDFVLILTYSKPHEPKVIIQKDSTGDYAAMITLFPDLEFAEFKTEVILNL